MLQKKKIAVLGCGWLGFPLANSLLNRGHVVHGSTTKMEKLNLLRTNGINPFIVLCKEDETIGLSTFLHHIDLLIITMPPGLRNNKERRFDQVMIGVVNELKKSKLKQVIFISSTSVYGDQEGEISEQSDLDCFLFLSF